MWKENMAKYVRISAPDKEKLASLVIKAKGPTRSMRKFAEDIGVNASTLSRIVNQKTAGANTVEIITGIGENADPDSGVTTEMLMDANGMAAEDTLDQSPENLQKLRDSLMKIVADEMFKRNYSVNRVYRMPPYNTLDSVLGRCILDFSIKTDAIPDEKLWFFNLMLTLNRNQYNEDRMLDKIRQWLLMYTGMLAFNEEKAGKLSVILIEEEIYGRLIEYLKGFNLRYDVSLILVDVENERIASEYIVKDTQEGIIFTPIADESKSDLNNGFQDRINYDVREEMRIIDDESKGGDQ